MSTVVNGHDAVPLEWNGRAIKLVEFSIRDGRDVRTAYAQDGELGMWTVLMKSARYADDDAPVFVSVDDVEAQPFRLQQRLMRLAAVALDVNGFQRPTRDGDDPSS